MTNLVETEGIAGHYAEKLHGAGIGSVEALLEKGATPEGREEIAEASGLGHGQILKWVNHADLFRVDGVEGQYAELLEASGVDTVVELAQRNPQHLAEKLAEVNEAKHLVRRLPGEKDVERWIAEAKSLPRVVSY